MDKESRRNIRLTDGLYLRRRCRWSWHVAVAYAIALATTVLLVWACLAETPHRFPERATISR